MEPATSSDAVKVNLDTGVRGLTTGLATLPKVHPGASSGRRQGWNSNKRTSGGALLLYA